MTERDAEGRPIATKNAGAFLGPFSGAVPVPSTATQEAMEPETFMSPRTRWLLAAGTAIALFSLGFAILQILLDGTEAHAESAVTAGQQLLVLIHADWFLVLAHAALLAVGVALGARFLSRRDARSLAILLAVTIIGALLIGVTLVPNGAAAALIVVVVSLVWLLVAFQYHDA